MIMKFSVQNLYISGTVIGTYYLKTVTASKYRIEAVLEESSLLRFVTRKRLVKTLQRNSNC
jgi:hypothetical protein